MTFYVYYIYRIFLIMVAVWFVVRSLGIIIREERMAEADRKFTEENFVQIGEREWVEKSYYKEHKSLYSKI